jgi:K+-transporting ATPase ATPase A chain
MTANGIFQILLLLGAVVACVKPLGSYMARVFQGERTFLDPLLVPVERLIYRVCGVRPEREQHWTTYTIAMLLFNVAGLLVLYAMQRLQGVLPSTRRASERSRPIRHSTRRSASPRTRTGSRTCRNRP